MNARDLVNEQIRIKQDAERQKRGDYTPLELLDKQSKEESIAFYKEQRELIADQKEYGRIIRFYSKVTMWATIVMAIATVVIAFVNYLQYSPSGNNFVRKTLKSEQVIDSSKTNQEFNSWKNDSIIEQSPGSAKKNN